ncbi:MAG: hypothetical protein RJQ21_13030 [Rhodospirillales bacterium]
MSAPTRFSGKDSDLAAGARNLLEGCAEIGPETSVLIISEPETEDFFDPGLPAELARHARAIAGSVEQEEVPFNPVVSDPDAALLQRMAGFDRVIFLARLGDQLRFRPSLGGSFAVMCYTLDRDMLASRFGRLDHAAFAELKALVDRALAAAGEIRITCPAGTDFRGPGAAFPGGEADTSVRRFPLSVFTPVPAAGFEGRIAQAGFLCGTGSQFYKPQACEIRETLFVHVEGNRIRRFEGAARDVAAAEAHYGMVAGKFGLDRSFLHSWHAGIHPGLAYRVPANTCFDRWSNGAFGNPRIAHFHTCGRHAPGEISLNLLDHTITLDGVRVWEDGRLYPDRLPGGGELLARYPDVAAAFDAPAREVGFGEADRLTF